MTGRFPPPGSTTKWAGRAVTNARTWYANTHPTTHCARCHQPITGPWHLGHKLDRQAHPHLTWEPSNWQAEHARCSSSSGATQGNKRRRKTKSAATKPQHSPVSDTREPGRPGATGLSLPASIPAEWRDVPWMRELIEDMPDTAVWPRIMSGPHPRAVGSVGWRWIERIEERRRTDPLVPDEEKPLRWFQKLQYVRAGEVDGAGLLVWEVVAVTSNRQVGKSVGVREVCLDRASHGLDDYGEQQLVLHVARDLQVAEEVQLPARQWATVQRELGLPFKPINTNGKTAVECPGGRWLVRAENAAYGYSASMGMVDECWDVKASVVSAGISKTMAARRQPQLWLLSTAHAQATDLFPTWREKALAELVEPRKTLLVEWSAEPDADDQDEEAWRAASPHWDARRRDLIAEDVGTADFREQWLNIWPRSDALGPPSWLDEDAWAAAHRAGLVPAAGGVAAVEDELGGPGGFAALAWPDGDRVLVTALRFDRLEEAYAWADGWEPSAWLVGYSLRETTEATSRRAAARSSVHTSSALPEFRRMVAAGGLVWDGEQLAANAPKLAVRDNDTRSGLQVVPTPGVSSAGVRCAAWAACDAQRLIGESLDDWIF